MPYERVAKKRIYPDKKQEEYFLQAFGCARFVRNNMIRIRDVAKAHGEFMDYDDTSAILTMWRNEEKCEFLRIPDSTAMQQTLRDLDAEYFRYYSGFGPHPEPVAENVERQSYKTAGSGNSIRIRDGMIRIPKAGFVRMENADNIEEWKICSVIIERTGSGEYYATVNSGYIPETEIPAEGCM